MRKQAQPEGENRKMGLFGGRG